VTLLDEPLAGMDAPSRESLLRELPRILRELATVIVVTHDRDEALRLAEDVVLLVDGMVTAAGPISDVFGRPPNALSARFLGWSLISNAGAIVAIRPGALVVGEGDRQFPFDADQVIRVGERWDATGRIEGVPASLSGRGTAPTETRICVSADAADVVEYPPGNH
jgi:ABC-type sulfate/molybdate transport systems ATPase subunit